MKKLFFCTALILVICSCTNNEVNVETKTSTDTMTNITNPGVGSAADDTSSRDNNPSH